MSWVGLFSAYCKKVLYVVKYTLGEKMLGLVYDRNTTEKEEHVNLNIVRCDLSQRRRLYELFYH